MKSRNGMMLPPVLFFIFLAITVLLLSSLILPFWITKSKEIEKNMKLISHDMSHQIISEIQERAELLSTMNSSAPHLAKVLNSSLYGVNISFRAIQDRVSPILFQAISTIPLVSYISYTGVDNISFSYYYKDDQILAVYANSSQFTNISFIQQVNPKNGKLYGEPASLIGTIRMGNDQDFLFNQTAEVAGKGSLSLAFSGKKVAKFFSNLELYSGYFCLATREEKVIAEGAPNTCQGYFGNLTCGYNGSIVSGFKAKNRGNSYNIFCSTLDILGVQSVYKLAFPSKEIFEHREANVALVVVILIPITMILFVFVFVLIILRSSRRETNLQSRLIKQMEATHEAEKKNLNKSIAFANTSHDIRASLAGITGWANISLELVKSGSDLAFNLEQIKDCAKELLVILNSILDTSKIEAGKMQLEEKEFDMAQLLEDVVDLFHPVGISKGVDIILDPCDGSIFSKYPKVKGDRVKIRKILTNLLSNAVKCTSKGHVVVRGWAKKPTLNNPKLSNIQKSKSFGLALCLFCKENGEPKDEQTESRFMIQENSDILEFIFEVDDSGLGIPKEKQKAIFENYVQVEDKDELELVKQGTGLGLGIVQSLVRLMGGEIKIKDKKVGEKGACFWFNIFLAKGETDLTNEIRRENDFESQKEYSSRGSFHYSSPRPSEFNPKQGTSRVILFIQGEERRRVIRKFMNMVGIEVTIVKQWNQLYHILEKEKNKMLGISKYSTSSVSDLSISSENKSVPLSSMDGANETQPNFYRKTNPDNISNFVLIIIDISGGRYTRLRKAVDDFSKDIEENRFRVVWINKPGNMIQGLDDNKLPLTDFVVTKPFHGSTLNRVIGLLPEFGGKFPCSKKKINKKYEGANLSSDSRILENGEGRTLSKIKGKEILKTNYNLPKDEILSGKKVLVVEDNALLRRMAITVISKLGAIVESCENGEEAVNLVSKGLNDRRKHMASTNSLPYDYIFMDCEMPVMDGLEATRRIREEGKYCGIHIPIIALTAHTSGEEVNKMMQTGIDFFLNKPLNKDQLIEAIIHIYNTNN